MARTRRRTGAAVLGVVIVAGVAGGAVLLPPASAPTDDHPTVPTTPSEEVRPTTGPMDGEIAYYMRRVADRGPERFALERSFAAEMLAFRAFGEVDHLTRARQWLEELEDHHPSGLGTLSARSSYALATHDFVPALEAALSYRERSGADAAKWRLFDALWAVGDHEGAEALLSTSVDTTAIGTLSRRARVLDAEGEVERARDLFRRVVALADAYAEPAPVRAWALAELGHFELHSGSPEVAVRRYHESLSVLPGNPAALEGLSSVAEGVERDPERAAELLRIAVHNGAHPDAALRLADLEEAIGRPDEASALRSDFLTQAAADPDFRRANLRPLANILAEDSARLGEAERAARDDLAQRQDADAYLTLGWVLHQRGDTAMAWLLAERAVGAGSPPPPRAYRAGVLAAAAGAPEAEGLLRDALEGRIELSAGEEAHARALLMQL